MSGYSVFREARQGECKFQRSKIQRKKEKSASDIHNSAHYMSVVELELLITLKENKANISSGPHAASWARSVVLKVAPRQPGSGGIKTSGIRAQPQDETHVLAAVLMQVVLARLSALLSAASSVFPHLVRGVSVLQSNVRHKVSRTPQTRCICFTNCCCWSGEHTL